MNRKAFKTCAALAATALGLLGGASGTFAQTPPTAFPGDWPNLGAFNNRQGQNGNPADYSSGRTELRWLVPNTNATRDILFLDNTSFADTTGMVGGPYDPPVNGVVSTPFPSLGAWAFPAASGKEATAPFTLARRLIGGVGVRDRRERVPAYYYTFCTPCRAGQTDPTVPADATKLKSFTWTFNPIAGVERTYAIYAWLPTGTTDVSPTGAATPDRRFPQRYFVYEIRFGQDRNGDGVGDQRVIDVLDTGAVGGGFVRLGPTGSESQAVFPSTGTPIRVRLFNTVPRNTDGSIAIEGADNTLRPDQEENLANKRLVYADATQAIPQPGQFIASPTAATIAGNIGNLGNPDPTADWRVTVAQNAFVPGLLDGAYHQTTAGTIVSYQANPLRWNAALLPQEAWRYSIVGESANNNTVDDDNPSATFSPGWTDHPAAEPPPNPRYIGNGYKDVGAVVAPAVPTATATYQPILAEGNYELQMYVGGNAGAELYARAVRYEVFEGGTLAFVGFLDQSRTDAGWVRLGNRRYDNTEADPLRVVLYNVSSNPGDAGRKVFGDAMRFVAAADTGVSSTPVHATVNITGKGPTQVVIVPDESGKIHCLDLVGNGDGTTTEYWSYPSTPNFGDNAWIDPNLSDIVAGTGPSATGIDGRINPAINPPRDNAPTATMPTSFDLSTALVANVGGRDLLYVGATNGRVYCIDMQGRGDYNAARHLVGTTTRQWTFPDDYNPQNPDAPIGASGLGAFRGSLVYGDATTGAPGPTIFVPARQGRVYALDATGATTTRTTTVRWQYPLADQPTLPAIDMTPTLFQSPSSGTSSLFFGTERNLNDDGPGQFYALNPADGSVRWRINGPALGSPGDTGGTTRRDEPNIGAFIVGPVAVARETLEAVPKLPHTPGTPTHVDSLYVLNNNGTLYGLDAATGLVQNDGTRSFIATDIDDISDGNLTYTVTSAYNRLQTLSTQVPVIVVPGTNGVLAEVFARIEDYNNSDGYLADFNVTRGGGLRSAAAADNFLFTADEQGGLYAFDNIGAAGGNYLPYPFDTGVTQGVPPNDPRGNAYRHLRLRLINKQGYALLRDTDAEGQGSLTYNQAVNDPAIGGPPSPYAFEWGEKAYVLVYNFPFATQNQSGDEVPPPSVTVTLHSEGRSSQQKQSASHKFAGVSPDVDGAPGVPADGYAVFQFSFQNAGANALPPGPGYITASLTSAALGTTQQPLRVSRDSRDTLSRIDFFIANPLRLEVVDQPTSTLTHGIGNPLLASDPSNAVNGSPDVAGGEIESQLLASAGLGQNGATSKARFYVVDRSLMALERFEGINNVRLTRSNLQRQGGAAGLYNPLDPVLYPRFEDRPGNFPNTSLDYPDIGREQVRAVKDPAGTPENPLLTPVTLRPPLATSGAPLSEDNLGAGNDRVPQRTPFELAIDIPRYQPPVNTSSMSVGLTATDNPDDLLNLRRNSVGTVLPQGYFGRVQVFVDSSGDGKLTRDVNREVYRAFNYSVGVLPQWSIQVGSPNVDLGSLAAGTGYTPLNPSAAELTANRAFNPWLGAWGDAYRPISVKNDGNVNLLNLRLAKAANDTANGGNTRPWAIDSADSDPLAWLSGTLRDNGGNLAPGALWSNIDTTFAATYGAGVNRVILPKPRVTDRVPTDLVANPYPRANPNTGANGSIAGRLNAGLVPSAPKVGVAVPIGAPVGNYSSQIRVFEDGFTLGYDGSQILQYDPGNRIYEAYSDPITLTFKVRETRMTNRTTPRTAPVLDDPSLLPNAPTITDPNRQPTGSDASGKNTYRNAAPGAMRDVFGSLIVAWESDRDRNNPTNTVPMGAGGPTRIFLGSLDNAATFGAANTSAPAGNAPLWDLTQFAPVSNTQWFRKANDLGYPDGGTIPSLFVGGPVVGSTVRFGSPSFPAGGSKDPLTGGALGTPPLMGFVGNAQVTTATGRLNESRVFVATVASGADGSLTVGDPIPTKGDVETAKGKPSVLQLPGGGALVFYSETSAGASGITVSRLRSAAAGFANPVSLNFGDGFSSVFSPSASARVFRHGAVGPRNQFVELSFAGKLRGRPNAEVYIGRLNLDLPITSDPNDTGYAASVLDPGAYHLVDGSRRTAEYGRSGSPFQTLPRQTDERMVNEGNGVYRARGVLWARRNTTATTLPAIELVQTVNGGRTSLLVGTPTIERQSGLIAYDSRLGGKVYIDPELGTVKFVGAVPSRNAELRVSYTPTFLRVTPGGSAAYSAVNGLWDDRFVPNYDYWFTANSNATGYGNIDGSAGVRNDRYYFAYGRGAAGGGVTARPYSTSMRLGVRLPTRIATDAEGKVLNVRVIGATRPYQLDPANGRIYFQAEDENRLVRVTYTGVDEGTNAPIPNIVVPSDPNATISPSFILERTETILPVDEAANDSALTAFLDPFTYASTAANPRERPPLVWLFYVSTRAGGPDLYFQTVAPRFTPFAK